MIGMKYKIKVFGNKKTKGTKQYNQNWKRLRMPNIFWS